MKIYTISSPLAGGLAFRAPLHSDTRLLGHYGLLCGTLRCRFGPGSTFRWRARYGGRISRRLLLRRSLGWLFNSSASLSTHFRRRSARGPFLGSLHYHNCLYDEPFTRRGQRPVLLAGDTGRLGYLGRRPLWDPDLGVVWWEQGCLKNTAPSTKWRNSRSERAQVGKESFMRASKRENLPTRLPPTFDATRSR